MDLSSAGSTFQTAGPAKENAGSANLVRVHGLMKVLLSEECRLEWVTVPNVDISSMAVMFVVWVLWHSGWCLIKKTVSVIFFFRIMSLMWPPTYPVHLSCWISTRNPALRPQVLENSGPGLCDTSHFVIFKLLWFAHLVAHHQKCCGHVGCITVYCKSN